MQKNHQNATKSERGQSFMELAISIVFLLILLAAVIDLGWAFYTMTALRDTAQEAASYGTMCPDIDLIKQRLRLSTTAPIKATDIDPSKIQVTFLDLDGNQLDPLDPNTKYKGNIVHVSVEIEHHIETPFISTFIGTTTYPLRADVSDTVMVEDCP